MRLNPLQASANIQRSMGSSTSRPPLAGETRARANSRGTSYQNRVPGDEGEENPVVWEVGSVSDDSDTEGKDGKEKAPQQHARGVGGVRDGYGERGGLLYSDDEELEEDRGKGGGGGAGAPGQGEGYETVRSPSPTGSPVDQPRRKPGNDEDPFGDFEEAR